MKENVKYMLMYSKAPSMMKTTGRKKVVFYIKLAFPTRTKKNNS
jgi:hypothetical protein